MKPIQIEKVQEILETFENKELYLHLETTSGAYAAQDKEKLAVGAYIRNGSIKFTNVKMAGSGPFRVGFKLNDGWMYAEGLTDYQLDGGRLLMAGHDSSGRLAVAVQLSYTPFD
ncbi:YojF family protein [Pseudalkalibacillus hwajinpoensis]|uniref:YojF family protein n=1 Tax=Guptibacillus hwajinpoensis TaxID=208199 RepID=UPI001CD57A41|nr:YojF family protein [Pseudalkalibacillus hwajinpoensis]MCA0990475.1 YojF family protein [Pseudalkalibacillus hwajinpoensis]